MTKKMKDEIKSIFHDLWTVFSCQKLSQTWEYGLRVSTQPSLLHMHHDKLLDFKGCFGENVVDMTQTSTPTIEVSSCSAKCKALTCALKLYGHIKLYAHITLKLQKAKCPLKQMLMQKVNFWFKLIMKGSTE